ncbi:hypothetical protein BDM02DRAFT_3184218 [Thelephora ganbajun]|uniref:Uncharacterized protein n=1 Tax=Thelephora ganbajun TaxID=370292 RepID=A0ACB6ZQ89_THEGA|nr:hypothetical protein BDM02DRAFT_3184218 [Thelephora ganbajun]
MLHARLSTRPTSFRKSNITAVSEYPPQLDDDDSNYTANLRDCVLALGDCGKQAARAKQILHDGCADLPRTQHVVHHEKYFTLVSETTVREYKSDLREVIEPQVNELIERAEKGLRVLERREASLKARADTTSSRPASRLGGINTTGMNKLEARKMQMLLSQRKKLEEELLVLEDEILNAERKPLPKTRK